MIFIVISLKEGSEPQLIPPTHTLTPSIGGEGETLPAVYYYIHFSTKNFKLILMVLGWESKGHYI